MSHLKVDPTLCIGAGLCVMSAGEIFTHDPRTGLVMLRVPAETIDLCDVAQAADVCPSGAIRVVADPPGTKGQ